MVKAGIKLKISFVYWTKIIFMDTNNFLGSDIQPENTPSGDEKNLALLTHLLTFVFPLLAPLIIYLVKKDESYFVAFHAKEALNFQITLFIIMIVLFISIIGILLTWIVGIIAFALIIVATIKAAEGKLYSYPFTIRFIK